MHGRHSRRAAKLGVAGIKDLQNGRSSHPRQDKAFRVTQKRTRVKGAIEEESNRDQTHTLVRLLQNCPVGQLGEVCASGSKALSTARKPAMTLQGSQDKALAGILPQS